MFLHWIQMNVMEVLVIVLGIPNPVVCKSATPNLHIRSKFLLGVKRKPILDELNCPLDRNRRSDQQVKMVGHQNEFVQEI